MKQIVVFYVHGDPFLDQKLSWLKQYGNVELRLFDPDKEFKADLLVIDSVSMNGLSEILIEKNFIDYFYQTTNTALLAMNVAALQIFETLGGKVEQTPGHQSKSFKRIRRHGVISRFGKKSDFLYSTVPSVHEFSMLDFSLQFGDFISYSTSKSKRTALRHPRQSSEYPELFIHTNLALMTFCPYLNENYKYGRTYQTIQKELGDIPSDYILNRLLYPIADEGTSPTDELITV